MHVNVDVKLARELEDSVDLTARIRIRIGRSADRAPTAPQRLDHQLIGTRIVQKTLLGKHTDLQIDRPRILADQRQYTLEAAQTDPGIDLEMGAHMGRALED